MILGSSPSWALPAKAIFHDKFTVKTQVLAIRPGDSGFPEIGENADVLAPKVFHDRRLRVRRDRL
jgi:hypothetical protein